MRWGVRRGAVVSVQIDWGVEMGSGEMEMQKSRAERWELVGWGFRGMWYRYGCQRMGVQRDQGVEMGSRKMRCRRGRSET